MSGQLAPGLVGTEVASLSTNSLTCELAPSVSLLVTGQNEFEMRHQVGVCAVFHWKDL